MLQPCTQHCLGNQDKVVPVALCQPGNHQPPPTNLVQPLAQHQRHPDVKALRLGSIPGRRHPVPAGLGLVGGGRPLQGGKQPREEGACAGWLGLLSSGMQWARRLADASRRRGFTAWQSMACKGAVGHVQAQGWHSSFSETCEAALPSQADEPTQVPLVLSTRQCKNVLQGGIAAQCWPNHRHTRPKTPTHHGPRHRRRQTR